MASKDTKTAAKTSRGPQKRSLHIFYRADGNGGVEIVNVMTDARKVLEYVDSPEYKQSGFQRFKFDLVSEPRGSKGEADTNAVDEAA